MTARPLPPYQPYLACLAILAGLLTPVVASAEFSVELPALAARSNSVNDPGTFTIKLLWWDQQSSPDPVVLKWGRGFVNAFEYGRIRPGFRDRNSTFEAFAYAVEHTPGVTHSGTVNVQGIAYGSTRIDGSSAGGAMAVGFMAMFKQEPIQRGIAMTGTLQPGGRIGRVSGLPGKVRAAAREGYHTILIPSGQLYEPRWQLQGLALELGVTVKEVETVEEAYGYMTGTSF